MRYLIIMVLFFVVCVGQAFALDPSTNDLWDDSNGTFYVDSSVIKDDFPAENMFGGTSTLEEGNADYTIFSDGQDAGYPHWIEWETADFVRIDSFNLVANDDDGTGDRAFKDFNLYGWVDSSWQLLYSQQNIILIYDGGGLELYSELEEPVTAKRFMAEFVQYSEDSEKGGPRITELDGYGPEIVRDQGKIFGTDGLIDLGTDVWSQSITAGITGKLYEVQIQFESPGDEGVFDANWTFSILSGSNPGTGSTLFSQSFMINESDLGSERVFTWNVSSANLIFKNGDSFIFEISCDVPEIHIAANYINENLGYVGYDGGELYENNNLLPLDQNDMAFITYVYALPSFLDYDGDVISNVEDNCPTVYNPDQMDENGNGIGDICEDIPDNVEIGDNFILGSGSEINSGVIIDDNVVIEEEVVINRNSTVGSNVYVGAGSFINQDVTLGDGVTVGSDVTIGKGTFIGQGVEIGTGTFIGKDCYIGDGAIIGKRVVIGRDVTILAETEIPHDTVIGKEETVPSLP